MPPILELAFVAFVALAVVSLLRAEAARGDRMQRIPIPVRDRERVVLVRDPVTGVYEPRRIR